MTPGLTGPLRAEGFPVEDEQLLLVKLPSGGFGLSKRESSPGRFGPAFLIDAFAADQFRTRSVSAAFQTGMPPRAEIPEMLLREASLGLTGGRFDCRWLCLTGCCFG